jgi:NitT/TauT family transport system substrate-binding protein
MSKKIGRRAVLAGAAALSGFPAVHAQARQAIKFSLNTGRDGSNAPFFLAEAKGYFREAGIDITLDPSRGTGDVLQRVGADTYDVGYGDLTAMIQFTAREPQQSPVSIATIYTRSPVAIITLARTGIARPQDLVGKRLGAPVTDGGALLFPAFAQATGIRREDVAMQNVDFALREALLMRGEVDAITGFDSTSAFNLRRAGARMEDIRFLYYADAGLNFYSNSILASKKLLRERAAVVPGLTRALIRGFRDAVANPQEAVEALYRADGLIDRALEVERLQWLIRNQIVTDHARRHGLGYADPAVHETAIGIVVAAMALPRRPTAAEMLTDRFLPPAEERRV